MIPRAMTQSQNLLALTVIALTCLPLCSGFVAPSSSIRTQHLNKVTPQPPLIHTLPRSSEKVPKDDSSLTKLYMAGDGGGGGLKGALFSLLGVGLIVLYVGTNFLPMMAGGGGRDLSIADSVVTRQDAPGKLQNNEFKGDRLSRSSIQEKLNTVPVFYLVNSDGEMDADIYMSYADAKDAAGSKTVKATTLDQVTYPLVLKRGRMRMAPPPSSIEKAEEQIRTASESGESSRTYRLVPSKTAVSAAKDFNMDLADSDIPLFVADRLAFAGNKGPQLPLFLEKDDCETSYNRLRDSSSKLPEKPNIRTTTLMDTLKSMETGSRPGVSQLAFYSSAEDLIQATDMMQSQQ